MAAKVVVPEVDAIRTDKRGPDEVAAAADGPVQQFGALCVRAGPEGSDQVLIITTRQTRRWTIPKGWPIKGLHAHRVAEREAWEEAGVKGRAKKKPVGHFTYRKILADGRAVVARVMVHPVTVNKVRAKFPEHKERKTAWVSPEEAALRVLEPELKGLLERLVKPPED